MEVHEVQRLNGGDWKWHGFLDDELENGRQLEVHFKKSEI